MTVGGDRLVGEVRIDSVFTAFGEAARHAQFFEAALKDFLSVWRLMSGDALSLADLDAWNPTSHKRTMGPLLQEFKKRVKISDDSVLVEFSKALKVRNFLMHSFFLDRMEQFNSDDGLRTLLLELADARECLEKAGIYTRAINEGLRGTLDGTRVVDQSSKSLFSIEVKAPGE
jgi:hypothetical protein